MRGQLRHVLLKNVKQTKNPDTKSQKSKAVVFQELETIYIAELDVTCTVWNKSDFIGLVPCQSKAESEQQLLF